MTDRIKEINKYFKTKNKLKKDIRIGKHELITDVPLFIDKHLSFINSNSDKYFFEPYLIRLEKLKNELQNNLST